MNMYDVTNECVTVTCPRLIEDVLGSTMVVPIEQTSAKIHEVKCYRKQYRKWADTIAITITGSLGQTQFCVDLLVETRI